MMGRWRDEFNAGRAKVREAAARGRRRADDTGPADAAGARPDAGEDENLRALLAEVTAVAEQSQARVAELEGELKTTRETLVQLAEVLLSPGVKTLLYKRLHPDASPKASEDEKRELTARFQKITAVYELIEDDGEKQRAAA